MLATIQVIIPALNEETTIGGVVTTLRSLGLERVRVVDNGSSDATAARARAAGAEVVVEPVAGYGRACWRGYEQLAPEVEWVLFCDADGSDDLADVRRMVAEAEAGAELVLGDRRARAAARAVMTPVQRWGNGLATTLIRWGWGHRFGDLGPLRLIRRSLLERIGMRDRGFGWTIEMQVRAVEEGARVVEIPVGYARRGGGRSKISGTVRGSVAAGTVILGTLARLAWRRQRRGRGVAGDAAAGWTVWASGGLILAGAAAMMPWGEFGQPGVVRLFLLAAAIMSMGFVWSWRVRRVGLGWFWVVAAGARLLLLPMAPGDDVARFVWEGRIQLAGFSPYLMAPEDPALSSWRDAGWAAVNHPEHTTIYPPGAQALFRLVAALGGGVVGLKVLFAAADLGVSGLLARRFGAAAAIVYAWNPLVIYSAAGGGHFESVFVLGLVGAWLAWDRGRERWAAWWLGVSVAVKWVSAPLGLWLAWRWRRHPGRAATGALLAAAPLLAGLGWLTAEFGAVGPLVPVAFVEKARTLELVPWLAGGLWEGEEVSNYWIPVVFAVGAVAVVARTRRFGSMAEGLLAWMLVCAPSVHAWYFVWLMPWAVMTRNLGARLLAVSGFAYFWVWDLRARTGEWEHGAVERLMVWLPFVAGMAWSKWREGRT